MCQLNNIGSFVIGRMLTLANDGSVRWAWPEVINNPKSWETLDGYISGVKDINRFKTTKSWVTLEEYISGVKDINRVNMSNETVLHVVLRSGDMRMVKLVVEAGADVRLKGSKIDDLSCLYYARDMDMVKYLLNLGLGINDVINSDGDTLIHKKSEGGNLESVEWLLENGADPNIKNNEGKTALHVAMENRMLHNYCIVGKENSDILDMLVRYGGDVSIKNDRGETPMEVKSSVYL